MGVVLLRLLLKAQVQIRLPAAVPRSPKVRQIHRKNKNKLKRKRRETKAEKAALEKVTEAESALSQAEANPTKENYATASAAIQALPENKQELTSRLAAIDSTIKAKEAEEERKSKKKLHDNKQNKRNKKQSHSNKQNRRGKKQSHSNKQNRRDSNQQLNRPLSRHKPQLLSKIMNKLSMSHRPVQNTIHINVEMVRIPLPL